MRWAVTTVWAGSTRATRLHGTYELLGLAEVVDNHDEAQSLSGAHVDPGLASIVDPQPVWGGGPPGDEPVERAPVRPVVRRTGDCGDLMDGDGARVERRVHVELGVDPLSELETDSRSEAGQAVAVDGELHEDMMTAGERRSGMSCS